MKVVIPAAGLGTRFLPATKSQPKEMLPVLDRPIIQYVVEEAVASGADDILIVTGRGKRALEDHFDHSPEFDSSGKYPELEHLAELVRHARIHFVRQREPRGLADAIGLARQHTGSEPFGVLLGDTINVCEPPLLRQLWDRYEKLQATVMAVEQVAAEKVHDYGIVEGKEESPGVFRCERLLEKPDPSETRSRLGITGAYVFTPDIYSAIDRTRPDARGELQITDALQVLTADEPVYATTFQGTRYDIGDRFLWLRANLEFAYGVPEHRARLRPILERLLEESSDSVRPHGSPRSRRTHRQKRGHAE
ncbi:MAG: UTP--glucose-1-phosphate uridylyltransferase [Thermoplasmata archaeon]|nr:UTP--glucose-1-phosphate uridylyltransferase [Thermoplasmata archaeon]